MHGGMDGVAVMRFLIAALMLVIPLPAFATNPQRIAHQWSLSFIIDDTAVTPANGCVRPYAASSVLAVASCDSYGDSSMPKILLPLDSSKTYRFTDMICLKGLGTISAGEGFTVAAASFDQATTTWTSNAAYTMTFDGDDADTRDPGDRIEILRDSVTDADADFTAEDGWGIQFAVTGSGTTPDWDTICALGIEEIF
jgi:hypothetical protein